MRWEFQLSLNEPLGRLMLAGLVGGLVAIVVWLVRWWKRRAPARVMPSDLRPFPVALYFGDDTCASCKPAAAAIEEGGLAVRQYQWADHGEVFDLLEIAEIPRLIVVGRSGQVITDVSGVPTQNQIARAKLQLSRE